MIANNNDILMNREEIFLRYYIATACARGSPVIVDTLATPE